jgi:hypothetical protein
MTNVLHATRQGFLGDVTWGGTWPGVLAILVGIVALTALADRGLKRMVP